MATDLCCQYQLDLATDLFVNQGGTSGTVTTIRSTSITGLDGRPIRRTIWPQGASDGGILGTARYGPRLITFNGEIFVFVNNVLLTPADAVSNNQVTTYLSAVNALVDAWVAGLEAVNNTAFNLNWTPTGLSADTLSVRYGFEGSQFQSTPSPDLTAWTQVTFGLVAASG